LVCIFQIFELTSCCCGILLQVDVTAMVPTVVVGLLQHLAAHNAALRSLKRLVIGGAAAPRSMIETLER
jgi:fatty-acyl-CoA synthase